LPLLQPSIKTLNGFESFTRVITHGRKYESKPIKAFVCLSPCHQTGLRIGFTVTRRIRKANRRNLLKRLMKEAFRTKKEDFFAKIESGILFEIVFMYNGDVKTPPKKVRFAFINQAMADLSSTINFVFPRVKT
jgi:ribonuclease P protein component